ncbi:hypothetical protein MBLNU459_g6453t1 [Dothideomycetes sp. NU459]
MATPRSTRLATAYALLDAYGSLSPEQILSLLDDGFQQQGLPESLGMPTRSKEEFRGHAAGITSVFSRFAMIPQAVYEDESANAVIIHAKMDGDLNKGPGGKWENECIMLLRMNEDGTKIIEIKEFVDSAKAQEMRRKVKPKHFGPPGGPMATVGWLASSAMPVVLGAVATLYFTGRRDLLRLKW